jgi:hypothetical protein
MKYDQDWLKRQMVRDQREVDSYKNQLINSLKQINKEEIFKEKKVTLWTRIKRTLGF